MVKGDFLITGLGSVSAAGENLESAMASIGAGVRNSASVSIFETSLTYPVFEYRGPLDFGNPMDIGRTLALLNKAVNEALIDSGLNDTKGMRIGICIGTTVASQLNDLGFYRSYRETGTASLSPVDLFLKGNPAEFLSHKLGTKGPSLTVVNACSSGTDAIGVALSWLKSDLCDIAIAGGADELSQIPYAGFSSLGILNTGLCRPFDKERKGLNLGEGAGIMVIEKRSSAVSRGVMPTLFLAGYGLSSDAYHLTAPSPDGVGLSSSIHEALAEACITPEEISFVNAHGTGTQDNDLVEGKVLAEIFGSGVTFLSTKGYTGHTLGAAGGLEAVFTSVGLREGWIPASAGFCLQDDAILISPVTKRSEISGRYALSTSLAFGGNNTALVIGLEG